MSGQGFGSFMEGMQGGMKSMSDLKDSKDRRKLMKGMAAKDKADAQIETERRKDFDLPEAAPAEEDNPFILRLGEHLRSKFSKKAVPTEIVDPTIQTSDTPMAAEDFAAQADIGSKVGLFDSPLPMTDQALADGGPVRMAEGGWDWLPDEPAKKGDSRYNADTPSEARARAQANRSANRSPPPSDRVNDTTKVKSKAIPTEAPKAGRMARAGSALKSGAAGALAGLSYGSSWQTGHTDTADIARELGIPVEAPKSDSIVDKLPGPLGDPQWRYDMGTRAVGAVKHFGDTILDTVGVDAGRGRAVPASPAPAAEPAGSSTSGGGPRRGRAAPRPAAAIPTSSAPAAPVDPLAGFDMAKLNPSDIPNFTAKDWEAHRAKLMRSYGLAGLSYAEAYDKVDQQVIAQQQRGFTQFAKMAEAALAAGDLKAAGTAVVAAFQNMPTTTHLKVGVFNNHLVGFPIDEDTGQQEGTPVVITPELLNSIMVNFASPQVWAEHAQDRTTSQQKDRELGQGDRRLDLMGSTVGVDAYDAETKRAIGRAGGAAADLKAGDVFRAQGAFEDWSYVAAQGAGESADPRLQGALATVALARYQEEGAGANPRAIMYRLEKLAMTPAGQEIILRAAASVSGG